MSRRAAVGALTRCSRHIGLAKAERVATLEIHWPTSGTTQVFRDIAANQAIEVTEFDDKYRTLDWKPIPMPKSSQEPVSTPIPTVNNTGINR